MSGEAFIRSFPEPILDSAICSYYGRACETLYCPFYRKRYVARDFLSGLFSSMYGVGARIIGPEEERKTARGNAPQKEAVER